MNLNRTCDGENIGIWSHVNRRSGEEETTSAAGNLFFCVYIALLSVMLSRSVLSGELPGDTPHRISQTVWQGYHDVWFSPSQVYKTTNEPFLLFKDIEAISETSQMALLMVRPCDLKNPVQRILFIFKFFVLGKNVNWRIDPRWSTQTLPPTSSRTRSHDKPAWTYGTRVVEDHWN